VFVQHGTGCAGRLKGFQRARIGAFSIAEEVGGCPGKGPDSLAACSRAIKLLRQKQPFCTFYNLVNNSVFFYFGEFQENFNSGALSVFS
jgi:hypothetical protein